MERVIVTNNLSDYSIAVRRNTGPAEKFAALELRKYLQMVSGVALPILQERAGEKAFILGEAAGDSSGSCKTRLTEDGFTIKTYGRRIYLKGGSSRAVLYAVYYFLEKYLGCGWCVPGDDTVPRKSELVLGDIDDTQEPVFKFRAVLNFPLDSERTRKEIDWFAKNRINWAHPCPNGLELWRKCSARETIMPEYVKRGLHIMWGGHTFLAFLPPEKYFDTHPEYYGFIGRERKRPDPYAGSLCVSNPEVPKIMAENIVEFAGKNPEIEIFDLWMNDTTDWCECEKCNIFEGSTAYTRHDHMFNPDGKHPSRSAAYCRFVNEVGEHVKKCNPNIVISPLSYSCCVEPPGDVAIGNNVLVGFALISRIWNRSLVKSGIPINDAYREVVKAWRKKTDRLYVYEYYGHFLANPLSDIPISAGQMAEELRYYLSLDIDKICTEAVKWSDAVMYAYARLTWNPDLRTEEIIKDFSRRYYGKAWSVMTDFWLAQEKKGVWEKRKKAGLARLSQAKRLAEDEKILNRITRLEKMFALKEKDG